jgi:hypothetical protein
LLRFLGVHCTAHAVHALADPEVAGLFGQQPQYQELQIGRGQFSADAEGSATPISSFHEPLTEVTKAAAAMVAPEKVM